MAKREYVIPVEIVVTAKDGKDPKQLARRLAGKLAVEIDTALGRVRWTDPVAFSHVNVSPEEAYLGAEVD